ncbi:imidazole glycerol phosphate synthase subunit HisH [Piscibacillus halophilus]|uniref:Imidazole glycerol phosphate synthase subunit HisH n=1 Tax=Piscibacillus halophilus TaxID=571933 RepID=A0A1H9K9L5_9BACI|nr:imidazole glycerol phosphate synthase subunit HisH [Piscibacillus halophilus]SEQ95819.1 glutamine amidotransferase [Piscibacillus halophilus]
MISIIDYGAGNLRNVKHALDLLGLESFITDNPEDLSQAKGMILPGVGAFGQAMEQLREKGFVQKIIEEAESGKPLLGICLGMQLLFDKSYEHGEHEGLGLISGEVVRFETDLKVPHMGWNQLETAEHYENHPIVKGITNGDYVYFVHSLFARTSKNKDELFKTEYDQFFTSAVMKENVIGMQFHPEKSSKVGMQLLKNFGEMVTREYISSN